MKKNKTMGRKLYSFFETYKIEVNALRMMPIYKKAMASGMLSKQFSERIMLAVTTVNGCPICSYAHTKYALESGMSDEEIQSIISSDPDLKDKYISEEEAAGISFAQHFADTRSKPDKKAWENIVERYGEEKANAILSAIRIITMGNALGVRYSGIVDRAKGNEYDHRTHLVTSAIFLLGSVVAVPVAIVHSLLLRLFNTSYISFD